MSPIHIRALEPKDIPAVHALYSQPALQRNTLGLPYLPASVWEEKMAAGPGKHLLVATLEGRLVGQISLLVEEHRPRRRHVGSLGMGVDETHHGKGIGTRLLGAALELADDWLGLTRLELNVYSDNAAAIALYSRAGFEEEGRHRHYARRDGVLVDALTMARVRAN
ncbi:GNAT family N-acetyltransferase [Larsenimonas suaedae]|uniref:GNAT family N-acetyltransferase n=1 Tax=Larsenimonas suaedae TaxID=1851019 RepID=A0ABU1GRL7_9GAMM|nr:GNAT family N-acetyltransferase [Larsenimonas suaedae]MCM2972541.1 GNAT family N-acetyltransferase [Larsenimonas suaedae]MDR5894663.1 GNAT family N-acetyltransferase [Larsenimonas suaedae]